MNEQRIAVDMRIQIRRVEERRLIINTRRCLDINVINERRSNPDRRVGEDRRCFERRVQERRQKNLHSN